MEKKKRRKRSTCAKPWLRRRWNLGLYDNLLTELRFEDGEEYKKFLWMIPENFDELLRLNSADITKNYTIMRDSIPANVALAPTTRYLATSDSYSHVQYLFRVHASTFSNFIPEVCDAIYTRLKEQYLIVLNYLTVIYLTLVFPKFPFSINT